MRRYIKLTDEWGLSEFISNEGMYCELRHNCFGEARAWININKQCYMCGKPAPDKYILIAQMRDKLYENKYLKKRLKQ